MKKDAPVRVFRVFRIFRIFRLFRFLRLFRNFRASSLFAFDEETIGHPGARGEWLTVRQGALEGTGDGAGAEALGAHTS